MNLFLILCKNYKKIFISLKDILFFELSIKAHLLAKTTKIVYLQDFIFQFILVIIINNEVTLFYSFVKY